MMIKNKILLLGLIITVALGGLTGCAGEITTTQPETTTPQVVTGQEETSSEEETTEKTTEKTTEENETDGGVMGYVDAEDICKHISINGKVVEFPWTLNELGDEYTFGENQSVDVETKIGAAYLIYNGKMIDIVQAKVETEMDRESLIYYITPDRNDGIYLYDINFDSTIEDVIARFGLPNETTNSDIYISYWYSTEDVSISFRFNEESGKVNQFSLILTEKYIMELQED